MASKITLKVDTSKVKSAANQVEQQMNTLQSKANQLVAAIEALKGAKWSGNAQAKVQSKCGEFKKGISTLKNRLDEEVKELREVASKYESTETANVNTAMKNLDGNVVR